MPTYKTAREMINAGTTRFKTAPKSETEKLDLYFSSKRLGSIDDADSLIKYLQGSDPTSEGYRTSTKGSGYSRDLKSLQAEAFKRSGFVDDNIFNQFLDSSLGTFTPASGVTADMRQKDPTLNPLLNAERSTGSTMQGPGLQYNLANDLGGDRDAIAARANRTIGQVVPNNGSSVTPVNQITPQTPLDFGTVTPGPDLAGATVAGAQAGASSASYMPPKTPTETKADALTARVSALLGETAGQKQSLADEEKKRGVEDMNKKMADLNSQILAKTAAYNQLTVANQGKPITMDSIIGNDRQIINAQASDIGFLQAQMLGLQGQMEAAQEAAAKAVDLKYAAIFDELRIKQGQLELLQPALNKEEAAQASALNRQYAEQQQALQDQKDQQKQAVKFALENSVQSQFFTMAGTVYRTSDGKAYSSPDAFFADGGSRDFSNAPVINIAPEDKLLSVAEAKSLGVPYGTTQNQAIQLGITPVTPRRGNTGDDEDSPTPTPSNNGFTSFPKSTSTDNIRKWLAANWHKKQGGTSYYDVWGQAANIMKSNGVDPAKFDKTFWDVFRPGEYEANKGNNNSGGIKPEDV